jgi:flavodoxin
MYKNYNRLSLTILLFFLSLGTVFSSGKKEVDAMTNATTLMTNPDHSEYNGDSKILIILFSSKNNNTVKIANAIAKVLDAEVKSPQQVNLNDLRKYDLIGFGSGIFDGKHHVSLLELVNTLPPFSNKKTFIFSTSGVSRNSLSERDDPHIALREILITKGFNIVGEFNCVGFNNNNFLKIIGGMNKGRPNNDDLRQAEEFAKNLLYML